MSVPNLSGCSWNSVECRNRWWRACTGETRLDTPRSGLAPVLEPPNYRSWKDLDGATKWAEFHNVAIQADEHPRSLAPSEHHRDAYLTPYKQWDIVFVTDQRLQSIEHVVPKSYYPQGHVAPNDPNGWIDAYAISNRARGNKPLVLWDAPNISPNLEYNVDIDGVTHFCPPLVQRPRLARKWLYMRATYADALQPSLAQLEHKQNIIDLVVQNPPSVIEMRMDSLMNGLARWSNPLISNHEYAEKHFLNNVYWGVMTFDKNYATKGS